MTTTRSALATILCGRINVFSLYLPGAAAAFGGVFLVYSAGNKYFNSRVAFFAALASMLTWAGAKEFGLARTDGVFAFTVAASALLAFRAWTTGRGWTWFWLAAAIATLTKGPLGLVLAAGGLLAVFWERKSGEPAVTRGSHVPGVLLYALIVGGWFALAWHEYGRALADKMLLTELVGHAVSEGENIYPGMHFYQPPFYYLAQSAPWSILASIAIWRVYRHPARQRAERQFERFLCCWFLFGLAIFSMAPHQRADHLWPILPASALLAGRELDRLTRQVSSFALRAGMAGVTVLALACFAAYYLNPPRIEIVRQTAAWRALAMEVERCGGTQFPLTHVDDPMTFQIWLNTLRPRTSMRRAAELLRGPEPAFIVVSDTNSLQTARRASDPQWYTLPVDGTAMPHLARIVSNHPKLEATDDCAFYFGPLLARAHHARLVQASDGELRFSATGTHAAEVFLCNQSVRPQKACVCIVEAGQAVRREQILSPGQGWRTGSGAESPRFARRDSLPE